MTETETAIELALRAGTPGAPASDRSPIPLVGGVEQDPPEVSEADERQKPDPKTSPAAPRAPPGRVLIDRETRARQARDQ